MTSYIFSELQVVTSESAGETRHDSDSDSDEDKMTSVSCGLSLQQYYGSDLQHFEITHV